MSDSNIYPQSKPISIKRSKSILNNSIESISTSPNYISRNAKHCSLPAHPSNNINASTISPSSSPSSLDSPLDKASSKHLLDHRMNLNMGVNPLKSAFFQAGAMPFKHEITFNLASESSNRPAVRREYTFSNPDETVNLAEKWGFGIRSDESQNQDSYIKPIEIRKTRADFIRGTSSNRVNRSRSPMRDMMLKGHFDM